MKKLTKLDRILPLLARIHFVYCLDDNLEKSDDNDGNMSGITTTPIIDDLIEELYNKNSSAADTLDPLATAANASEYSAIFDPATIENNNNCWEYCTDTSTSPSPCQ